MSTLRNRLKARGSLRTVLRRLDQRLALLASATAPTVLWICTVSRRCACRFSMSGLQPWFRYLRAAALGDRTVLPESSQVLALLLADGQHQQARRLIEQELRRCPTEQAAPLRAALGEVLLRSGRPARSLWDTGTFAFCAMKNCPWRTLPFENAMGSRKIVLGRFRICWPRSIFVAQSSGNGGVRCLQHRCCSQG